MHLNQDSDYNNYLNMQFGPKLNNTSNLVLLLDANNNVSYPGTGTTWTDLSGNGFNGTLVNGPTFNRLDGGTIGFDGTNDCVTLATNSAFNFGTGDFSIFCWIKTSKVSTANTIFSLDDTASGNGIMMFSNVTTGVFRTWVAGQVLNSSTSIANGTWNYVGITRRSGTVYQYINGLQVGSFSSAGSVLTNQIPRFGNANSSNANMFQGSLSMCHIYNRALTNSEILESYNNTKVRFVTTFLNKIVTKNIVLLLDASDTLSYPGSGTTWTDLSGNGNNGTLTNGPTFGSANGGSIVFDGIDDYVSVPNAALLNSTTQTISVWYMSTSLPARSATIVGKHDAFGSYNGYNILTGNTIQIKGPQNGAAFSYGPGNALVSVWYFATLTMTINGPTEFYVNGVSVGTGTTPNFTMSSNELRIGRSSDSFWSIFTGRVAYVSIYDRILTSVEILQNYNATKSRFGL